MYSEAARKKEKQECGGESGNFKRNYDWKIDILCEQETRWKGSNARRFRGGFESFYHNVYKNQNRLKPFFYVIKDLCYIIDPKWKKSH